MAKTQETRALFVGRGELNPQAILFLQKNVSGLQMAFRTKGAKTWHLPTPGHQGSSSASLNNEQEYEYLPS